MTRVVKGESILPSANTHTSTASPSTTVNLSSTNLTLTVGDKQTYTRWEVWLLDGGANIYSQQCGPPNDHQERVLAWLVQWNLLKWAFQGLCFNQVLTWDFCICGRADTLYSIILTIVVNNVDISYVG